MRDRSFRDFAVAHDELCCELSTNDNPHDKEAPPKIKQKARIDAAVSQLTAIVLLPEQ